MTIEIGHVESIFRYPVKSMAGERLDEARLGEHGLDGDRRLAFRKTLDRSGFPWLTAGRLPDLLRYHPTRRDPDDRAGLPTHVRTPEGDELAVLGDELAKVIELLHGAPVEMMEMKHGIFDEACVSVISLETIREIERAAGTPPDARRFRPNVLLRLTRPGAFQEDRWVGGTLSFGDAELTPSVSVTARDVRCSMVNLDPDTARSSPEVLKAIVRMNDNYAGVYGVGIRCGRLAVGQTVRLHM
ncbi:MAG: MOSC N-terminal beta barrel domain-containing protein [Candidatus Eisenbacteria bacterium]